MLHLILKFFFLQDANGKNALGKVWPGSVYFLDFHNPNTTEFWQKEVCVCVCVCVCARYILADAQSE